VSGGRRLVPEGGKIRGKDTRLSRILITTEVPRLRVGRRLVGGHGAYPIPI